MSWFAFMENVCGALMAAPPLSGWLSKNVSRASASKAPSFSIVAVSVTKLPISTNGADVSRVLAMRFTTGGGNTLKYLELLILPSGDIKISAPVCASSGTIAVATVSPEIIAAAGTPLKTSEPVPSPKANPPSVTRSPTRPKVGVTSSMIGPGGWVTLSSTFSVSALEPSSATNIGMCVPTSASTGCHRKNLVLVPGS